MANPANITLRSEKGSFITFEEMDRSMLEVRDLITEYEAHVNNEYTTLNNDFQALQTDYNQYKIDNDAAVAILMQNDNDFDNQQTVQDSRITANEYDIAQIKQHLGI